jgi:predicted nucleic acid-binding protein
VVVLPEIVDYEHRRKMLHIGSAGSVRYLDELKENIAYAPLNTRVMLRAARLWADARKRGLPTAPEDRLDVDVILASQALDFAENGDQATIATTNPRHLSRFVDARDWQEIEA